MKSSINIDPTVDHNYQPLDMDLVQFMKDSEVGIYILDLDKILILHNPHGLHKGFSAGELIDHHDVENEYDDKLIKYRGQIRLEND